MKMYIQKVLREYGNQRGSEKEMNGTNDENKTPRVNNSLIYIQLSHYGF